MKDKIEKIKNYIQTGYIESLWESRFLELLQKTDCDLLDLPEVVLDAQPLFDLFKTDKTYDIEYLEQWNIILDSILIVIE